ncbi:MAG: hypothetical protein KVP17_004264 [Porospora cf. gigantea B]|uniref:uncharacterized protein n=2 Tax=Porospora cf. gigantea B TaxID=2853592 RepID=UPI0035719153|nr:MAG: hypothetical protein KVP17_004264 [Porospora cf. gigantea B]
MALVVYNEEEGDYAPPLTLLSPRALFSQAMDIVPYPVTDPSRLRVPAAKLTDAPRRQLPLACTTTREIRLVSEEHIPSRVCILCGSELGSVMQSHDYFRRLHELFRNYILNYSKREDSRSDSAASSTGIPRRILLTGYFKQFFVDLGCIGRGSFGSVHLCGHVLDRELLGHYACKLIPVGDDRVWLVRTLREVKVRERFHHKHIVDYNHSWLEMHRNDALAPEIPWLFILMEYCNAGDLHQLLTDVQAEDGLLSEHLVWCLFFHILKGLHEMHQGFVLHRDLKPSNVLLHCEPWRGGETCCWAKLADFGTATGLDMPSNREGFTGTMEYTAPELLRTDADGVFDQAYGAASDIYSLGLVLCQLTFGELPFTTPLPVDVEAARDVVLHEASCREYGEPLKFAIDRSPSLKMLVNSLLSVDPTLRPTTQDLILQPFLQKKMQEVEGAERDLAEMLESRVSARTPEKNATAGLIRNLSFDQLDHIR